MGAVLLGIIAVILLLAWLKADSKKRAQARFERDVQSHVSNLKQGGLIPKAAKSVHNEALRRIAADQPNVQLPTAKYYETSSSYDEYKH